MAWRSFSLMFSNFPGWIYPKQMYFTTNTSPSDEIKPKPETDRFARPIVVGRSQKSTALKEIFLLQAAKSFQQESAFRLLLGEGQCLFIGGASLSGSTHPAAQI